MMHVLSILYSLPFLLGAIVGAVGMRLYQRHQCRKADHRHPLPNGRKHRMPGINHMWAGGLLTLAVLGYVLLQVEQTEQHYRELGDEMRRCQVEFHTALVARSAITTENDRLSREQRDLLVNSEKAEAEWISQIIDLPPEIASLPDNDPRIQQYGQVITRVYRERIDKINTRLAEISEHQRQLAQKRAENPLPEPSCGQ